MISHQLRRHEEFFLFIFVLMFLFICIILLFSFFILLVGSKTGGLSMTGLDSATALGGSDNARQSMIGLDNERHAPVRLGIRRRSATFVATIESTSAADATVAFSAATAAATAKAEEKKVLKVDVSEAETVNDTENVKE